MIFNSKGLEAGSFLKKFMKSWLKNIKEHLNKWKYISCSHIGRLSVLTMSIFLTLIYRLSSNTLIIIVGLSVEFHKMVKKFLWKGATIEKVNLRDEVEGLALPCNKTYLVAIILWYKQIDQWYRINSPERDQPIYGNTVCDGSSIGKDELSNRRWGGN